MEDRRRFAFNYLLSALIALKLSEKHSTVITLWRIHVLIQEKHQYDNL